MRNAPNNRKSPRKHENNLCKSLFLIFGFDPDFPFRPKLAADASIDLKGCNTARERYLGFGGNTDHITKQLSIELPNVPIKGTGGFAMGNQLAFPGLWQHYIRFSENTHIFFTPSPKIYLNGKNNETSLLLYFKHCFLVFMLGNCRVVVEQYGAAVLAVRLYRSSFALSNKKN